jgi:hypothetical protein
MAILDVVRLYEGSREDAASRHARRAAGGKPRQQR